MCQHALTLRQNHNFGFDQSQRECEQNLHEIKNKHFFLLQQANFAQKKNIYIYVKQEYKKATSRDLPDRKHRINIWTKQRRELAASDSTITEISVKSNTNCGVEQHTKHTYHTEHIGSFVELGTYIHVNKSVRAHKQKAQ